MATLLTSCNSNPVHSLWNHNYLKFTELRPVFHDKALDQSLVQKQNKLFCLSPDRRPINRFALSATTKGSTTSSQSDEEIPSWAKPDSDVPPPWAREEGVKSASQKTFEIPFYVYLLASAVTAIAAIGSVFEYVNQKPVFGLLNSDSVFYAPVLGFFTFTGIPTSAFLWFKSVQAANKASEEQDRRDGFL